MSFHTADSKWTALALGEIDEREKIALERELELDSDAIVNLQEIQSTSILVQDALQELSVLALTPEQRQSIADRLDQSAPSSGNPKQFEPAVLKRVAAGVTTFRIAAAAVILVGSLVGIVSMRVMRNRPSPRVGQNEPRVPPLLLNSGPAAGSPSPSAQATVATATPHPLVLVDRDGRVIRDFAPPGLYYDFRISPDGALLAADRTASAGLREVWVVDPVRQTSTRLSFGGCSAPVWAPDGHALACAEASTKGVALYQAPWGSSKRLLLTSQSPTAWPFAVDWSPDGRFLLLQTQDPATGWDLWLLPVGGGQPSPFIVTRFNEGGARFSPDGRWLAYTSDESGREEIYVRPFPEFRQGRWQVSAHGGRAPRWRRDGRELFYIGPNGTVISVQVQPGAGLELNLGSPQALFQNPMAAAGPIGFIAPFDVLPDREQFILLGP